jgi:hypothetical protein
LVRFQPKIDGQRNNRGNDEEDANQIAQWDAAHEKEGEKDRAPNDGFPKVRLHQN